MYTSSHFQILFFKQSKFSVRGKARILNVAAHTPHKSLRSLHKLIDEKAAMTNCFGGSKLWQPRFPYSKSGIVSHLNKILFPGKDEDTTSHPSGNDPFIRVATTPCNSCTVCEYQQNTYKNIAFIASSVQILITRRYLCYRPFKQTRQHGALEHPVSANSAHKTFHTTNTAR